MSQPDVKPPSSWDGLEGLGGETAADRSTAGEVRGGGCRVQGARNRPRPLYLPAAGASCWWGVGAAGASDEFLLGLSPSAMLTSQTMVAAVGGGGHSLTVCVYTGRNRRNARVSS